MDCKQYLIDMENIQDCLLKFLENKDEIEELFRNFTVIINDKKILDDKLLFTSVLHLICKISLNYHKTPNFFCKIEKILQFFKNDISKHFSNAEIFDIFKDSRKLLLFLFEEKMIILDEYVVKRMSIVKYITRKYPQYFQPELKALMNEPWFPKYNPDNLNHYDREWIKELNDEFPSNFYELRKIGENESEICRLIREDLIKEFIVYINKNSTSVDVKIKSSIYETNQFFLKYYEYYNQDYLDISLIEYAAFFGSIQIFKYLLLNHAKLDPLLWLFAIHGNNPEIIHLLEENKVHRPIKERSHYKCYIESIKCHHNDITNYIINNYFNEEEEEEEKEIKNYHYRNHYEVKEDISVITKVQSLKYYNFAFIPKDVNDIIHFCRYDYGKLVNALLKVDDNLINYEEIYLIIIYKI